MEDRIVKLEAAIAHQEKMLDEVNEVVTAQQAKIDQLEGRIEAILQHLKGGVDVAGE